MTQVIEYKGLHLCRTSNGTRVAVSRSDGDCLSTFPNWTAAITFVDRIVKGVPAIATLKEVGNG